MTNAKDKITFAVNGETFGNFKLREKNRKVKLYIKLNKEEAQQWETLRNALSGGQMTNDTLARVMFFKGIMVKMSAEQADAAMEMAEEEFAGKDNENTSKDNN